MGNDCLPLTKHGKCQQSFARLIGTRCFRGASEQQTAAKQLALLRLPSSHLSITSIIRLELVQSLNPDTGLGTVRDTVILAALNST